MKSKCALIGFVATIALGGAANADPLIYEGICDASAAVALDSDRFVVGNDEDNTLRVYRQGQPRAMASISLDALLDTHKETDIEGAALVGTASIDYVTRKEQGWGSPGAEAPIFRYRHCETRWRTDRGTSRGGLRKAPRRPHRR